MYSQSPFHRRFYIDAAFWARRYHARSRRIWNIHNDTRPPSILIPHHVTTHPILRSPTPHVEPPPLPCSVGGHCLSGPSLAFPIAQRLTTRISREDGGRRRVNIQLDGALVLEESADVGFEDDRSCGTFPIAQRLTTRITAGKTVYAAARISNWTGLGSRGVAQRGFRGRPFVRDIWAGCRRLRLRVQMPFKVVQCVSSLRCLGCLGPARASSK